MLKVMIIGRAMWLLKQLLLSNVEYLDRDKSEAFKGVKSITQLKMGIIELGFESFLLTCSWDVHLFISSSSIGLSSPYGIY